MDGFLPYISSSITNSLNSFGYFKPELALAIGFCLVIFVQLFLPGKKDRNTFSVALLSLFVTMLLTLEQFHFFQQPVSLFGDMLIIDKLGILFKFIFLLAAFLFMVFVKTNRELCAHPKGTGDLFAILLAITLGMNLMAMASNMLMVYLSMEMVSFGSYLLVGYSSQNKIQTEASIKYVLFGAVCSAIMLYGLSLVYGLTGTLSFQTSQFLFGLTSANGYIAAIAVVFIGFGIGFKLSAVPFHFWSPDVYEGAPTPVTAFLSTGVKAAGFALISRLLWPVIAQTELIQVMSIIAILTMIAGNFAAIWQDNIKRMLAYSSIGHTGFLLIAAIVSSQGSINALLFYLFVYVLMNNAAFMIASQIEELTGAKNISDYKGLGKKLKGLILALVIILISLTGLPPTGGFFAKLLVFSSAIESYNFSGSVWMLSLMITGALTTVISLFYYFKVPLNAYLRKSEDDAVYSEPFWPTAIIWILTAIVIIAGIFPQLIF